MTETLEEFRARLERATAALQAEAKKAAIGAALQGESAAKRYATSRLRVRAGTLRRSIKGEVRTVRGSLDVVVSAGRQRGGKALAYAQAQERGATIRPVRGRYLAIPLAGGPALTGAGVPRFTSPRDVAGLVPFRSRSGRLLLVRFTPAGVEGWYLLHPGPVTITGKHYVRDGAKQAREYLIPRLDALLGKALE